MRDARRDEVTRRSLSYTALSVKRSSLKRNLLAVVATYLGVCLLAFGCQRQLLYFPGREPMQTPAEVGLAWQEVPLETDDGEKLGAWLVEHEDPRGCILFSHGNAGSRENRLHLAQCFAELGFASLHYDYRGYGGSTGSPSETGLYRDGLSAYAWVRANGFDEDRIVLWGESLGGGVATELARKTQCAALMLDHTFTSMTDVASEHYPWLPVRWLLSDRYESLEKLSEVKAPVLVIHSPQDELIPYSHAVALADAASDRSELVTTSGGHNGLGFMGKQEWIDRVREFLENAVKPR